MTVLQVIALETPAKKPKPVGAKTFKTKQHFGSTGVDWSTTKVKRGSVWRMSQRARECGADGAAAAAATQ